MISFMDYMGTNYCYFQESDIKNFLDKAKKLGIIPTKYYEGKTVNAGNVDDKIDELSKALFGNKLVRNFEQDDDKQTLFSEYTLNLLDILIKLINEKHSTSASVLIPNEKTLNDKINRPLLEVPEQPLAFSYNCDQLSHDNMTWGNIKKFLNAFGDNSCNGFCSTRILWNKKYQGYGPMSFTTGDCMADSDEFDAVAFKKSGRFTNEELSHIYRWNINGPYDGNDPSDLIADKYDVDEDEFFISDDACWCANQNYAVANHNDLTVEEELNLMKKLDSFLRSVAAYVTVINPQADDFDAFNACHPSELGPNKTMFSGISNTSKFVF